MEKAMSNVKPESLTWLDKLSALEAELAKKPSAKNTELAKTLKVHKSMVTHLKTIKACFDQAAIDKVHLAVQGNPPHILSFNSAMILTGLIDKATDLHGTVHAALDIALSKRLVKAKIEALVEKQKGQANETKGSNKRVRPTFNTL
jgi:hypothetical protein